MMITQAAVAALRTWRRRYLVVLFAIGVTLGLRCRGRAPSLPIGEVCREAAEARRPDADRVCATAHVWFGDGSASAWHAVGRSLRETDHAGAETAYRDALDHRAADDIDGQLDDLNELFVIYRGRADFARAIEIGARAFALAPRGSIAARSATYLGLGGLMLALGNLEAARQTLALATLVTPPWSPNHARVLKLHGLVEQALGHPKLAWNALVAARSESTDPITLWEIYTNLLGLAIERDDVAAARALVANAPRAPETANDRAAAAYYRGLLEILERRYADAATTAGRALRAEHTEWEAWLEAVRGRALLLAGDLADAERALQRSTQELERQRAKLGNNTLKSELLAKERAPFEDLFLLYLARGQAEQALDVAQRATGRSLLDDLLAREADQSLGDSFANEASRVRVLDAFTRSTRATPAAGGPAIGVVLERLRGNHVITYFRARGELWAIAVRGEGAMVVRRLGDAEKIDQQIDEWFVGLGAVARTARHDQLSEALGAELLPDELMPEHGDEPVYLVPDAPVRNLPFAALRRHGAYAVQRNPFAYGISLASLVMLPAPSGRGSAVVLGDPWNTLRDAREEALEVAAFLGVAAHVGTDATRARLVEAVAASVLHVAAHTNGTQISLADGMFDAADVLVLPRVPALVTLLGCSSARRQDRDELGSLAASFLAAGAHTVVAALWSLDDHHGKLLANELYDEHGPRDPITSLARAQRKMIASGAREEQWSTFVVLGGLNSRR